MLPKTYNIDLLMRQLSVDAKWESAKRKVIPPTLSKKPPLFRYNYSRRKFGPAEEEE